MTRTLSLIVLLWIAFTLPIVEAVPIAYIGNITTSTTIIQNDVPATFTSAQTHATGQYSLHNVSSSFGTLRLSFVLDSFAAGPVVFLQNGTPKGDATLQVNAITDVVNVTNLVLDSFSDISTWSSAGALIAKNFSYTITQVGLPVGTLGAELRIASADVDGNILSSGSTVGHFAARNQVTPFVSTVPIVTNLFAGFVRTENNRNYHGQVLALVGPMLFSGPITLVGNKTGYGFGGAPLLLTGPLNSTVYLFVNNHSVRNVTLTSDTSVRRIDLVVPIRVNDPNYPDEDLDGVPDTLDKCPNSRSFSVDVEGCTCEQLLASQTRSGGTCTVVDGMPVFVPPAPDCTMVNSCVGRPGYCNANKTVVNNCGECGCPDGFECNPCPEGEECITDGGCYKTVEPGQIVGLRCMKNKFQMGAGLDCSQIGPTFVDLMAANGIQDFNSFIHVHTDGDFFSGEDEVEKEVEDKLSQIRVCVDTQDYGCVSSGTKCPGQETLATYLPQISGILQGELDKSINQDNDARSSYDAGMGEFMQETFVDPDFVWISSTTIFGAIGMVFYGIGLGIAAVIGTAIEAIYDNIAGLFGDEHLGWFDVDIELSVIPEAVAGVKLNVSYPCDTRLVSSAQSCKSFIQNGDSENKIDLLFIGDGYSEAEFNSTLSKLLDYRSNATATQYEGLFSREPFKSYKSSFNVWTIATNLNHSIDEALPSRGEQPDAASVHLLANSCPTEHTFVISKNNAYASDCSGETTGFCALSMLGEPLPGRQLLRLAAKRIAKLADEFVFHIDVIDTGDRIEGFDTIGRGNAPNCQATLAGAQSKWGNLQAASGGIIAYFPGCGGTCGNECEAYLRPTFNSPLRNVSIRCAADTTCRTGPPYDPFWLANEREIAASIVNATS